MLLYPTLPNPCCIRSLLLCIRAQKTVGLNRNDDLCKDLRVAFFIWSRCPFFTSCPRKSYVPLDLSLGFVPPQLSQVYFSTPTKLRILIKNFIETMHFICLGFVHSILIITWTFVTTKVLLSPNSIAHCMYRRLQGNKMIRKGTDRLLSQHQWNDTSPILLTWEYDTKWDKIKYTMIRLELYDRHQFFEKIVIAIAWNIPCNHYCYHFVIFILCNFLFN